MPTSLKALEKSIIDALLKLGYISPEFVGPVTLYVSRLGLSDVDGAEKSLKRKGLCSKSEGMQGFRPKRAKQERDM
jgi:hypothetical protein